jgi:hypothetical protein
MNYLEEIAMSHLTKVLKCFIVPQYEILYGKGSVWSCPDFVVLDFTNKKLAVVEVTGGTKTKGLLDKINNRNTQYFDKLIPQLTERGVHIESWDQEIWVYIRSSNSHLFAGKKNVRCFTFEDIGYTWEESFWKVEPAI